jgi:hypothetical protein
MILIRHNETKNSTLFQGIDISSRHVDVACLGRMYIIANVYARHNTRASTRTRAGTCS